MQKKIKIYFESKLCDIKIGRKNQTNKRVK